MVLNDGVNDLNSAKSSDKNLTAIRQFVKKKYKKKSDRIEILYQQANRDFKQIIDLIIIKFNPKRIYQWGSLLNRKHFNESSDIDIAVEGIDSAKKFFDMLGEAQDMTDFSIDLVDIDKIHPLHAESIRRKGKVVYERT
jgi:predicted nucleotidyltransferase